MHEEKDSVWMGQAYTRKTVHVLYVHLVTGRSHAWCGGSVHARKVLPASAGARGKSVELSDGIGSPDFESRTHAKVVK